MSEVPILDLVAMTVILVATLRGLWIGMIREGLSLAAIGLCTIVTRLFVEPVSLQVTEWTAGEVTGRAALWIAGILLVMGTVILCGLAARLLRRGFEFAGLGWADRVGGGALGVAEGSIVAAILVLIALWLVGPEHPATEGARSVQIVQRWRGTHLEQRFQDLEERLPSVAAPGDWLD